MWKGTDIDYTIKSDFRINNEEIQDLDVKKKINYGNLTIEINIS